MIVRLNTTIKKQPFCYNSGETDTVTYPLVGEQNGKLYWQPLDGSGQNGIRTKMKKSPELSLKAAIRAIKTRISRCASGISYLSVTGICP